MIEFTDGQKKTVAAGLTVLSLSLVFAFVAFVAWVVFKVLSFASAAIIPVVLGFFLSLFFKPYYAWWQKYVRNQTLALAVMLFVSKGRLELVVYLATMLVLTISAKGSARAKVLIICLFSLAFIFFGQSRYAAEVIDSFLNSSAGGNDATGVIREAGREWYQYVMSSQPYGVLLGCGYPSTLYEPAIEMAGFQYGYFLVDNGIYGYRYVYGDLGVALVLLSLATTLWYSLRGRQDVFGSVLFAFYFFLFVPFINLAWWWGTADWEVLVAVFVALGWNKSIHLSKSGGEHAQKN